MHAPQTSDMITEVLSFMVIDVLKLASQDDVLSTCASSLMLSFIAICLTLHLPWVLEPEVL